MNWRLCRVEMPAEELDVLTAIPLYNDPINGFVAVVLTRKDGVWFEPDRGVWYGYQPYYWTDIVLPEPVRP